MTRHCQPIAGVQHEQVLQHVVLLEGVVHVPGALQHSDVDANLTFSIQRLVPTKNIVRVHVDGKNGVVQHEVGDDVQHGHGATDGDDDRRRLVIGEHDERDLVETVAERNEEEIGLLDPGAEDEGSGVARAAVVFDDLKQVLG